MFFFPPSGVLQLLPLMCHARTGAWQAEVVDKRRSSEKERMTEQEAAGQE